LISFPPGTEMFQFPGFALCNLYIQSQSTRLCLLLSTSPRMHQTGQRAGAGRVRCEATIIDSQVGCPIRRFRDQRVLSPPPDLSQSATSFIASCCQGIHQTPLSRLIRSRRRQALLKILVGLPRFALLEAVTAITRRRCLWSEVVDPTALPRQRMRRGRELRTILADQSEPTVSVI
jgi:hypothetical protein